MPYLFYYTFLEVAVLIFRMGSKSHMVYVLYSKITGNAIIEKDP